MQAPSLVLYGQLGTGKSFFLKKCALALPLLFPQLVVAYCNYAAAPAAWEPAAFHRATPTATEPCPICTRFAPAALVAAIHDALASAKEPAEPAESGAAGDTTNCSADYERAARQAALRTGLARPLCVILHALQARGWAQLPCCPPGAPLVDVVASMARAGLVPFYMGDGADATYDRAQVALACSGEDLVDDTAPPHPAITGASPPRCAPPVTRASTPSRARSPQRLSSRSPSTSSHATVSPVPTDTDPRSRSAAGALPPTWRQAPHDGPTTFASATGTLVLAQPAAGAMSYCARCGCVASLREGIGVGSDSPAEVGSPSPERLRSSPRRRAAYALTPGPDASSSLVSLNTSTSGRTASWHSRDWGTLVHREHMRFVMTLRQPPFPPSSGEARSGVTAAKYAHTRSLALHHVLFSTGSVASARASAYSQATRSRYRFFALGMPTRNATSRGLLCVPSTGQCTTRPRLPEPLMSSASLRSLPRASYLREIGQ